MRFPFVARSHHEEVVGELRRQLAEKEAERRNCWDLLVQRGFGTKIFAPNSEADAPEVIEPTAVDLDEDLNQSPQANRKTSETLLARMRPSQLMRKMEKQKMREFQIKRRLARKAEVLAEVAAVLGGSLPKERA